MGGWISLLTKQLTLFPNIQGYRAPLGFRLRTSESSLLCRYSTLSDFWLSVAGVEFCSQRWVEHYFSAMRHAVWSVLRFLYGSRSSLPVVWISPPFFRSFASRFSSLIAMFPGLGFFRRFGRVHRFFVCHYLNHEFGMLRSFFWRPYSLHSLASLCANFWIGPRTDVGLSLLLANFVRRVFHSIAASRVISEWTMRKPTYRSDQPDLNLFGLPVGQVGCEFDLGDRLPAIPSHGLYNAILACLSFMRIPLMDQPAVLASLTYVEGRHEIAPKQGIDVKVPALYSWISHLRLSPSSVVRGPEAASTALGFVPYNAWSQA